MLQRKIYDVTTPTTDLPLTSDDGDILLYLEYIIETWWIKRGYKFTKESLVKWRQLPIKDAP